MCSIISDKAKKKRTKYLSGGSLEHNFVMSFGITILGTINNILQRIGAVWSQI